MDKKINWQYDEFQQVGKDYGRPEEVAVYDDSHGEFREVDAENKAILDELDLRAGAVLVDIGCGTGAFAVQAAPYCRHVHAVDVSEAMLRYARDKAKHTGVTNIDFHHAGFLTYVHEEASVDAIVTTFALHHLPDFWKGIALQRMHRLLKPGGKLFLRDVVIPEHNALQHIAGFIAKQAEAGGDFLREDAEAHFREEYSTYDWIMDGLLTRAGFTIEKKSVQEGILAGYLCTRNR